MKEALFCGGEYCKRYIERIDSKTEIVCVADNYRVGQHICGYKIIAPETLTKYDFDRIVICINDYTNIKAFSAVNSIIEQLYRLGIPDNKIFMQNIYYNDDDGRICFLKEFSRTTEKLDINASIAECGVMRGHFAHYINYYFKNRKFYLYDTFQGLDERDIEKDPRESEWLRTRGNVFLRNGNEQIAVRRCIEPERVIVKKGYIPETFEEYNEQFIFVNLDMDLYAPTIASLRFFYDRMIYGGVILVHDYFNSAYPGIKKAIDEFEGERRFIRIPVRDGCSMCIIPL